MTPRSKNQTTERKRQPPHPFHEYVGRELTWSQPRAMKREFVLRAGRTDVAHLRWVKVLGSLAEGRAGDQRWTFKRCGFLKPYVSIRETGAKADAARIELGWWGNGTLHFPDGRTLQWARSSFWSWTCDWSFSTSDGRRVVQFTPKLTMWRRVAIARIYDQGEHTGEAPLLILLGWYLIVTMVDECQAATGIACT